MKKNIEQQFRNPDNTYRAAPFWSWNDDLQNGELCRQLDLMRKSGLGGSFLHSRQGLITPYMGKAWMDRVRKAVAHSRKTGMLAYLYDEDRWPSGFAGNKATRRKEHRSKSVACRKKKNGRWSFSVVTHPKHAYYNNASYLDTLSRKAVKRFIDTTYEPYRRAERKEFKKTIPGMFTDEPNFFDPVFTPKGIVKLPWTKGLDAAFRAKYGYDIRKNFVKLVENVPGHEKVRYDFWKLASETFTDSYGKQIYDWCDRHNLPFTGHYNGEDRFVTQIKNLGAAMPLYEYMHIPGIDHLTKNTTSYMTTTIKQCASVAHQTGKKRVLSEIYGASGQDMSIAERKQLGDWDIVLGINLLCPHLWLYSMRGQRKRDFPPTLSYQQPYWKYNRPLEDHLARMCAVASHGTFRPDMLIIHPIESAWLLNSPHTPANRCCPLNGTMNRIFEDVLGNHYDFDLGDEGIMARHGGVEKAGGTAYLRVGRMRYPLVVLPSMITIRRSTLALLEKFMKAGGKVLVAGRTPSLVDGRKDAETFRVLKRAGRCGTRGVARAAAKFVRREISVTSGGKEIPEIYCQKRTAGNREFYLLSNTSRTKGISVKVTIRGTGRPEYWDSMTGKMYSPRSKRIKGGASMDVFLPAAGSCILAMNRRGKRLEPADLSEKKVISSVDIPPMTGFRRRDPNSITLDNCSYRTGSGKWHREIPVLELYEKLEKAGRKQQVSLRYSFRTNLAYMPETMHLVLEQPEIYRIKVNGRTVRYRDEGWWTDTSFRKTDIRDYVKPRGINIIELSCRFIPARVPGTLIFTKNGVELESVYITGDFAVNGSFRKLKGGCTGRDFVIENESSMPSMKDTVRTGYPFFAGSMIFSGEFNTPAVPGRRYFLKFSKFSAAAVRVRLNGKEAGTVILPPYELDVTPLLKPGRNRLEVEPANTLRNLLGPHHRKEISPLWTGPSEFTGNIASWTGDYVFVDSGIGRIQLVTKRPA